MRIPGHGFASCMRRRARSASWFFRRARSVKTRLGKIARACPTALFFVGSATNCLSQIGRPLPRPGWAPDPLMVGIRSPDGLVVGSCTSHPGVLGSIPKREEPGKTGAPCVKVPGSSRVPAPPWVGSESRSPDGWDQIPRWAGGWVLHQPPWRFGFASQTRGTRENRRTLCLSTGFLTGPSPGCLRSLLG